MQLSDAALVCTAPQQHTKALQQATQGLSTQNIFQPATQMGGVRVTTRPDPAGKIVPVADKAPDVVVLMPGAAQKTLR